jgi:hypothetical protein
MTAAIAIARVSAAPLDVLTLRAWACVLLLAEVLDWSTAQTPQPAAKERWSKSLRLLRQVLMTLLADHGRNCRPHADGPTVRACDLELVRREFCRQYAAEGDEKQKARARIQAFYRAVKSAQGQSLIATRDVDGVQVVWLTKPEP